MSTPYRASSSYYKDSYENLPGKRFASSHYYEGTDRDDRKRHRLDAGGSSQTSSRYNSSSDYQHRPSSSYIGGKPAASYYEGTSHHRTSSSGKPSTSSTLQPLFRSSNDSSSYDHRNLTSSSKYMDSSSSRRYEDLRSSSSSSSKFSRIPPPLAAPSGSGSSYSSRKASNGNLLPLMKLSVDSSNKEYYGSRYRQAPPEHMEDHANSGKKRKEKSNDKKVIEKSDRSRGHTEKEKEAIKTPKETPKEIPKETPKETPKEKVKRQTETVTATATEKEDTSHSKALLKLNCHYCNIRCISFREFTAHLRSYGHTKSMNNAVSEMRKKLNLMRSDQRDQQRDLEKSESDKTLSDTTSYCRVCELNFRTDPTEHEANELHNQIKTLIYQRCDVCDIDFRIWKVYLYHMAALEHAKRVAMKELQERESRGETVKGTNLSQEELGFDLVEQRTVLYCNACIRYIPIKVSEEDTKTRHCMTFSHIKYVDEFNERERKYKEKKALEEERQQAAAAAAAIKEEEDKKSNDENMEVEDDTNVGANNADGEGTAAAERTDAEQEEASKLTVQPDVEESKACIKTEVDASQSPNVDDDQQNENDEQDKNDHDDGENEDEEDDEDEIELHADDDDDAEEESEDQSAWSRRTRSSTRKGSKSSDSNMN